MQEINWQERAIKAEAEVADWQDVAEQRLESHLIVTKKVCKLEAEVERLRLMVKSITGGLDGKYDLLPAAALAAGVHGTPL